VSDKRTSLRFKILSDLNKGEFKIGTRLPGEGELVQRYGVSRTTVRESIGMLVQEGVLTRRRGSGTYVESLQPPRKTRIITAIVRCIREVWNSHARIIQAIEDKVHEHGYSMILCIIRRKSSAISIV
jgi:DNA-binding GntR family transcriptional regulator